MIDTQATSAELAKKSPAMAFLPVGACEQHFGVLPLDSDIRQSARLARDIAGRFDSYLLPPLPFGTSLENTGAAGTVTLMPATLDAVVSDVVDSLYRQGFEFVVIVNSHGGNFALRPAVRRINYQNPGKKTIFVDPWEIVPAGEVRKIFEGLNELHCGEMEVSVMLYLMPELVRIEELVDGDPQAARIELDMFSIPVLAQGKPWGLAARASAEKGRSFYELMIRHSVEFIERIVERHRKYPSYHG
ncbi:MAG TPA: creatininase family protein [Candidatus Glassbacteria bacterium]|nr:creatininase family protein [Candidatus Glassbacteria bacterium]